MSEHSQNQTEHTDKLTDRKSQTRARVWRACEVCRKRKVKCNGQEPCAYCLSSGKICSFKDINDNAASARQQQTNSVEVRLSRVEESLQKWLPMAQAFEEWFKTKGQSQSQGSTYQSQSQVQNKTEAEADRDRDRDHRHPLHEQPTESSSYRVLSPGSSYRPSSAIRKLSLNDVPRSSLDAGASSRGSPPEDTDPDTQGPPHPVSEKWTERTTYLSKDSYGYLRYTGGASSYMLVDALTSLQDQNQNQNVLPRHTDSRADGDDHDSVPANINKGVGIQLPFFSPHRKFRVQEFLPNPTEIPYPPPTLADTLVTTYFSRIHHTFPILHQQSFVERYMGVMEGRGKGRKERDHAFLAVMFAVFACGACLRGRSRGGDGVGGEVEGEREEVEGEGEFSGLEFYEKAQLFFWMGMGSSQIEHVQCLAIMAICNASWNTLAQSWINAGCAIRRAQDLGLHRSTRRLPLTSFEKEIRRRVWWCVYGLDRVLSIALGRPSGAHDDDCDVELPSELDDAQLLATREGTSIVPSEKSYMVGFVALLEIYKIAGKIMRFVQSPHIDDQANSRTRKTVLELDDELANWINTLPECIRFAANDRNRKSGSDPKLLTLCLIAFFVYYSAIINLHRPFIPDYPTTSSDLSSLGHCLGAARSCIRIGEITQEMLPSSHHLAFAVQYITLSAVLLLRSIAYVNQPDLVSAIVTDAEKSIKILEGMESIWPASKRCREIVADLLLVVRTKLYGGTPAIEALQAAQHAQRSQESGQKGGLEPQTVPPLHNGIAPERKRKRTPESAPVASSSRQRLDDHSRWAPGSISASGRHFPSSNERDHFPDSDHTSDGPYAQRLSSLRTSSVRTSMDNEGGSSVPSPSEKPVINARRGFANARRETSSTPLAEDLRTHAHTQTRGLPQISLDITGLNTRHEIDGFPGYDFLGDDLFALVGSVVRPLTSQPSPHTFEENAKVLWQAYRGQGDVPFAGE